MHTPYPIAELASNEALNAIIRVMSHALNQSAHDLSPEALEGDLIQPGHPLFGIIWINPARLSGAPCFAGTRVPIKNLFDYLEGGDTLDEFLDGYPGVTKAQAVAVLEFAASGLLERLAGR